MNLDYKVIGLSLIVFFCWSCQQNFDNSHGNCTVTSELVNDYNFYNITDWRPFLNKRIPKDSLLQEKLLRLSILMGDFARDAIDHSGGMNSDGSLLYPSSKISVDQSQLNDFYISISTILKELYEVEAYQSVYKDLNLMMQHIFFSDKGSLGRNKILISNVELIASKLLLYENYCYFLIVKYA